MKRFTLEKNKHLARNGGSDGWLGFAVIEVEAWSESMR